MAFAFLKSGFLGSLFGGPSGPVIGDDEVLRILNVEELNKNGYINLPKSRLPLDISKEFTDGLTHRTAAYLRRVTARHEEHELIHPMFHRSRWVGITAADYKLLIPSLLLATRILDEPLMMPYFKGVLSKPKARLIDTRTVFKVGQPLYTFEQETVQNWHTDGVFQTLAKMNENVVFRFEDLTALGYGMVFAATGAMTGISSIVNGAHKSTISVSTDFLEVLRGNVKAPNISKRWTPGCDARSAYLRTQLLMAITLVHEILHALWNATNLPHPATKPNAETALEPYFRDQRVNELGDAWEDLIFGGSMMPIGSPKDVSAPYGLFSNPITNLRGYGGVSIERGTPADWGVKWLTIYPVEMEYIRSLFTNAKWQEVQRYGLRRLRRTRKLGVRLDIRISTAGVLTGATKPFRLASPTSSVESLENDADGNGVVRRKAKRRPRMS